MKDEKKSTQEKAEVKSAKPFKIKDPTRTWRGKYERPIKRV